MSLPERFNLHYMKVKQMVANGTLGDLISVFARRLNVITQADRINGRCGVLHFLGQLETRIENRRNQPATVAQSA